MLIKPYQFTFKFSPVYICVVRCGTWATGTSTRWSAHAWSRSRRACWRHTVLRAACRTCWRTTPSNWTRSSRSHSPRISLRWVHSPRISLRWVHSPRISLRWVHSPRISLRWVHSPRISLRWVSGLLWHCLYRSAGFHTRQDKIQHLFLVTSYCSFDKLSEADFTNSCWQSLYRSAGSQTKYLPCNFFLFFW